jgi:hypothetical protein
MIRPNPSVVGGPELKKFRDAAAHRVIRQVVTVYAGDGSERFISPGTADPVDAPGAGQEAVEKLNELASFAEDRWKEFWTAM